MKILVTGGAGYIGRTTISCLIEAGYHPVVLDSLIVGRREFTEDLTFYEGDVADHALIQTIFSDHPEIRSVIHFAARIEVEESTRLPSLYYTENLCKAQSFLTEVLQFGVKNFIFSSTAALYHAGQPGEAISETARTEPLSPYAASKLMFERVLQDICGEYGASGLALRYFNPIGADPKLRSGPFRPDPSNLLGKLTKLAASSEKAFTINGNDYPTRDGTPMRDFIHVWDLARAHLAALEFLHRQDQPVFEIINVGSSVGVTVKEFVDAFLEESGLAIEVRTGSRRAGDIAGAYADTSRAFELLGWQPTLSLNQGIADALAWERVWNARQGKSEE
ncbi:UDP-glucose 4-epimerase GalE [Deinococcus antarcticus]|uniref:UDP-glucose 4-epimerase n=1 Tax=Deinococcus antarcticus TaxID=1298767 RepID=A0ABV8AB96_9DEIO